MSRLEDAITRARSGARRLEPPEVAGAPALDWFAPIESPVPVVEAFGASDLAALPEEAPFGVAAPVPVIPPATPATAPATLEAAFAGAGGGVAVAEPPVVEPVVAPAVPVAPEPAPASEPAAPPTVQSTFSDRLIVGNEMRQVVLEQYRRIAAVLHHVQRDRAIKIVMVASAIPAEGKTLTAANLALTISESYKRQVLLIDADLRRPMAHSVFGISNVQGLTEVLNATDDRRPNVVRLTPQLSLLPAGEPDPDPMSGLTSDRMRRLLADASALFDWIVIDTPPVVLLPDANLLAAMVDAAVLVVGAGRTPLKAVQQAVAAIGRERILGVVLNRVEERQVPGAYGGNYYGGYGGYGATQRDRGKDAG